MKTIAAFVIVLAMVFGLGYMFGSTAAKHRFEKQTTSLISKEEVKQIVERDATIADLNVQIKTEAKERQIEVIKTQVVEKIIKSPPQKCEVKNEIITINPYTFDDDVVRLLNDARSNSTDLSTEVSDGASGSVAEVGVEELVVNDLEITKMYHTLGEKHVALQDYVKKYQEEGYQFCKMVKSD